MGIRKIIHIDMDAFYASVEQRDFPEYRGRPVIVGGTPDKRGVVAACSYEARKFGVHSAMSSARAARLCPNAIFIPPRFDAYRQVSERIMKIFKNFTDRVEPLSLDEAYLDVTGCDQYQGSATRIAKAVKLEIRQQTGLNASAGVSYNKFLAKIASDMDKPDGLYVITPEQGQTFVEQLPIGKFFGIGKSTEAKMKGLGIHNGADLKRQTRQQLLTHFGKHGNYYYDIARGVDNREVKSERVRKSISSEQTFALDINDCNEMLKILFRQTEKIAKKLQERNLYAKTVTIKVRYDDFESVTRSFTFEQPLNDIASITVVIPQLLAKTEAGKRRVRLLGVSLSNLTGNVSQLLQKDMLFV